VRVGPTPRKSAGRARRPIPLLRGAGQRSLLALYWRSWLPLVCWRRRRKRSPWFRPVPPTPALLLHRGPTTPAGLLNEYERPVCNRRKRPQGGTAIRRRYVPVTWLAIPIQPDQKTKSGIRVADLMPMKRRFAFCLSLEPTPAIVRASSLLSNAAERQLSTG
jgi:hypothetical protein